MAPLAWNHLMNDGLMINYTFYDRFYHLFFFFLENECWHRWHCLFLIKKICGFVILLFLWDDDIDNITGEEILKKMFSFILPPSRVNIV